MMNYFIYAGKSSREYGIYISGEQTFSAPERDIKKIEIPGRNGELTIDNGRFKNIDVTYPAFIRTDFKLCAEAARVWLLAKTGYHRLEDTYDPDMFRMARFSGPLDFDVRFLNKSAEMNLVFDCMPQRFLKSGEKKIRMNQPNTLINPYPFPALPMIRVYGTSGHLIVGNTIIQIKEIQEYIDIDSETQNAYKGGENCNAKIYSPEFPILEGKTGIRWEGNIDYVEITPRWWTI